MTVDAAPDRLVDAPPPRKGPSGRPSAWPGRFAEARKAAPKWCAWDYDTPGGANSAHSAAKKHAASAPGGSDAYEMTARRSDDGEASTLFVRYRKAVRAAS